MGQHYYGENVMGIWGKLSVTCPGSYAQDLKNPVDPTLNRVHLWSMPINLVLMQAWYHLNIAHVMSQDQCWVGISIYIGVG